MAIPALQLDGLLPPGVHMCTWAELEGAFGASSYRSSLLRGLLEAARILKAAGGRSLYIDGSFVTDEPFPGDFDACYDTTGVNARLLDPVFFDFANKRAAQKARFKGELFVANSLAAPGATFLDFFQKEKYTGMPKGIVSLDLGSLPV